MLRAALEGRSYPADSASFPRRRSLSRSGSNTSRLSSTSTTSHATLDPTTPTNMPSFPSTFSELSSSSSLHSALTFGDNNHSGCMYCHATSDSYASSNFNFNHSDADCDRVVDGADDTPLESSLRHVRNRPQGDNGLYSNSCNNAGFNASAMSSSTSIMYPVDSTSTLTSLLISAHNLAPRPPTAPLRERESVYSHQMASHSDSHINRMEFERRLHFLVSESEDSAADDFSYDSESTTDAGSNKWASSSDTNTKTNHPIKGGLRRLSSRFSRKDKRMSGSSASPGVRNTAVWKPSWSMALFFSRAKEHASEQQFSAPSGSSSEQPFSTLSKRIFVSCRINDRGDNSPDMTLQSSRDARGPTAPPRVRCPAETPQSTPVAFLRATAPTTRTSSTKPCCTCYNRNVRGPCIYHKNLKDTERISKRRSRDTLDKQSGKERSTNRSKARKRISHRLSVLSTTIATAAKRMSSDAGPKRTFVHGAPTAALPVEEAIMETKPGHLQKEWRELSVGPTFLAQKVYDHHSPSRPLNSSPPSVSSILDSHANARVSTVNVCAEIISPTPHIRVRSATIGGANEQEIKSGTHSRKRRSTIATTTVATTTTAALTVARTRRPSEVSTHRSPPYEKEKLAFFKPFKSQTQGSTYVSFHHDLSHLESSPLLENMDDNDASKESSSTESEHEEPLNTAPGSPIVPSQCSKPTRSKRTPPSLLSMSLPNLAGSAVNLMVTLPQPNKRRLPPPPPPRPRSHSPREDEGPFLTLQEYLRQKERALVDKPPKATSLSSQHSGEHGGGLNGMASTVSLRSASHSSVASSSAAASISGLSKVTKTPASQKRWGWLSWMGP